MSNLPITYTVDETMNMLKTRADSEPGISNSFFLKVYRRPAVYGRASEHTATFGGASLIHFAQPESWVPTLFGGGDYEVYGYDPADPGKKIGGMMVHSYPGERRGKPDFNVMRDTSKWKGPGSLVFPSVEEAPRVVEAGPVIGAPPPPGANASDPAGAAWLREQTARDTLSREKQELQLLLERERAERKAAEQNAVLREERARDKAESERQLRDLEAKFAATAATQAAAAAMRPQPSTVETVVALAAALAPVAKMFFDANDATRKLESERHREAQMAQTTMLAKMAEPKGLSPEVTMLLEMMKSQSTASGEMMSRMVEVMSAINGMSVSMVETMAANLGGENGNPVLDGVKDLIKAVASVQKGAEGGARRQVQQMVQPPTLPVAAQAMGPQTPMPQTQVQVQQHIPVHQFSGPPAPVATTSAGAQFPYQVAPNSTTAAIEGMIRNHEEPARVIDFIIEKVDKKDAELMQAVAHHNGDIEALIAERLGAWALINENSHYLDALQDTWAEKTRGNESVVEDETEDEEVAVA